MQCGLQFYVLKRRHGPVLLLVLHSAALVRLLHCQDLIAASVCGNLLSAWSLNGLRGGAAAAAAADPSGPERRVNEF